MKSRLHKMLLLCTAAALTCGLAACDVEDDAIEHKPLSVGTAPDPHEQEAPISDMTLTHERSIGALQARGAPLQFKATGAALSTDLSRYTVYLNKSVMDESALVVEGDRLSIASALKDGRNEVSVYAPDAGGAPVEARASIWAGIAVVQGRVVDEIGNPVSGAVVVGALTDDSKVTATTTTDSAGQYVLSNFPARTVIVTVTGPTGLSGSTTSMAGSAFPDVVLWSFSAPVSSEAHDFSQGTTGWINRNGARLSPVDHVENPGPQSSSAPQEISAVATRWLPFSAAQAQAAPKQDFRVGTSGQGPRTATYTFVPSRDAKTARIRYRFQTAEFPTYFGSAYNDSFHIALKTKSGKSAAASGAMNELGKSAFDTSGSTAWRDLAVELGSAGEPVQVEVTVANVGDGSVESAVIIDAVSTSLLSIPQARLFDIDNSSLQYLSAANHPYFNANTRVHATFKLMGPAATKLSSLELQVLQAGVIKAHGPLVTSLAPTLYKAFGVSGIELGSARLAFEIPAKELADVNAAADGPLTLKVVAKAEDGSSADKDMGQVPLLRRWTGVDRYGGRDEDRGGDDWLTVAAYDVCNSVSVTWGDFSNMNAGSFAPDHRSHTSGLDADGWYAGYNARDAAAAAKMLALLNTAGVGRKVETVYVSHAARNGDAFYDAYKDVTLADGRKAKSVIRNYPGHQTHFHWAIA